MLQCSPKINKRKATAKVGEVTVCIKKVTYRKSKMISDLEEQSRTFIQKAGIGLYYTGKMNLKKSKGIV